MFLTTPPTLPICNTLQFLDSILLVQVLICYIQKEHCQLYTKSFIKICSTMVTILDFFTNGEGTSYPSRAPQITPGFQWGLCYSIFSFICMLCRWLFVFLYLFFWPLCCLLFFDIQILITPLVSSNSSSINTRKNM